MTLRGALEFVDLALWNWCHGALNLRQAYNMALYFISRYSVPPERQKGWLWNWLSKPRPMDWRR